MDISLKINSLKKSCISCHECELSATRTNVVFGRGNINSSLLVIGEAPGEQEDLQGYAFIGRAGKMLDKMFELVDIDTNKDCFISNIVKCRPPNNRKPKASEISSCFHWLEKQVELMNPKVVVLAGSTAVQSYLQIKDPISKLRGNWVEKDGRKIMPIFHPSYLLRNPSQDVGKPKWLTLNDLKEVKKEINLITQKTLHRY